jgi:hypothetical protein
MTLIHPSRSLKTALAVDAASGAATAALQLAMPRLLADTLGLPMALLLETGLFLAGLAVLLAFLARSTRVAAPLVWAIVIGNMAWSAACVLLWTTGALAPTALGVAFLLAQGAAVMALAVWEAIGLKASRAAVPAAIATAH